MTHPLRIAAALAGWCLLAPVASAQNLALEKKRIRQWIGQDQAPVAIERLEALIPDHADDAILYVLMGEAHYALDHYRAAVEWFEKGIALRPDLQGRTFNLGRSYHQLGQYEKAASHYEAMKREENPALRSRAQFGLGLLYEELGDDERAWDAHRQSIAIEPDASRPRYRLGLMLLHQGKPEKAEAEFRFVLTQRPLHHGAAFNLSLSLLRQGKTKEAQRMRSRYERILTGKQKIAGFKTQFRTSPSDPRPMAAIADEYTALESYRDALTWYQRALRLDPRAAPIHLGLARALRGSGRNREAEQVYRNLLRWNPPERQALGPLLKLLEARGATEEAARLRAHYGG